MDTSPGELALPVPPIELRRQVGPVEVSYFDNPTRREALELYTRGSAAMLDYTRVLDFGCGCGRLARQMMQQRAAPVEYLGLDLNPYAIAWCQQNLAPHHAGFSFRHLDIWNIGLNPAGTAEVVRFPAAENHFTLAIACSVFTHIIERDVAFYMNECARVLADGGCLFASWFVFDKRYFPVLQDFQNSLYINLIDPINAVWFDIEFIGQLYRQAGLRICKIIPPGVRGFQFTIIARKNEAGEHVPFPEDLAPFGLARPPISAAG